MKFILTILLIPSLAFSKSSLFVNVENCTTHGFGGLAKNLKIFRDGVYISELTDSLKNKTFAIFRNIDPGIYQFKYLNQYDFEVQESITVKDNQSYTIDICVNKLGDFDKTFKGLIDSISPSTPFIIVIKSGGCFATAETKLKIVKREDEYFISYSNKVFSKGKLVQKTTHYRQIGGDQISSIRNFEYELNLINYANTHSHIKHICTSSSGYYLTLGSIKRKIIDSSCSWEGIGKVVNEIF